MIEEIKADFDHYCQVENGTTAEDCNKKLWVWFNGYGLQTLAAQRFYRWCRSNRNIGIAICKAPLTVVAYLLHKLTGRLYDIRISPRAAIGSGCYIGHFGGVRIGECEIGSYCNINQHVIICSIQSTGKKTKIGNRVWVGGHSLLESGVTVETGSAISAGTKVAKDIPERVLVAGPAARIMKRDYDNAPLLGLDTAEDN